MTEVSRGPKKTILEDVCLELGIDPSEAVAANSLLYKILQQPERFSAFTGKKPTPKEVSLLLKDILDTPTGYGIELKPSSISYDIFQRDPTGIINPEVVAAHVHPAERKPYSADCAFQLAFSTPLVEEFYGLPALVKVLLVADGSNMVVSPTKWPDAIPEDIKKAGTFVENGKEYFLPDVMWRTAVGHLMGQYPQTPYTQLVEERLPGAERELENLKSEIIKLFDNNNYALNPGRAVLNYINRGIGEFLRSFPGFKDSTYELYPSGVLGVVVKAHPQTVEGFPYYELRRQSMLSEHGVDGFDKRVNRQFAYAVCGDVAITYGDELLNDTENVDRHDEMLNQLTGRNNLIFVRQAAHQRRYDVGNLQGTDVRVTQGRKFNQFPGDRIILYTDGMKIDPKMKKYTRPNRYLTNIREKPIDLTASLLASDPLLTLLLRRRQNRLLGYSDDGAFLYENLDAREKVMELTNPNYPY